MKTYYLRRHQDVSGNSGCGRVAQVAEFDDGAAVLHWNRGANTSGVSSTEVFASVSDLLRVHGHDGRSVLEPVAGEDNGSCKRRNSRSNGQSSVAGSLIGRGRLAKRRRKVGQSHIRGIDFFDDVAVRLGFLLYAFPVGIVLK